MNAFKFNKDAKYSTNGYNPKSIDLSVLIVAVDTKNSFTAKITNPFKNYLNPPIKNDNIVNAWIKNPTQFYQNQINFAVFCATTGCGVSYANHLNHPDLLTNSVYNFHFYYQIRRILSELQIPTPGDQAFNPFNNRMNKKAYERICNEFGINSKTDFRQNLDYNHGLGTLYYKYSHRPYNFAYWPGHTSFAPNSQVHLGSIEQNFSNAWTTFILDTSEGFTSAGVERLNDSLRTYVWCLLGSQAQARSEILNPSTGFDAQKQYLANLEDSINSVVDLPANIKRYQDSLRYAKSKVDYAVGTGLYMLPSNMRLQLGLIKDYNNKIVIAGESIQMGINKDLNDYPSIIHRVHHTAPIPTPVDNQPPQEPIPSQDNHESEKVALVIGLTSIGLIYLYFFKK